MGFKWTTSLALVLTTLLAPGLRQTSSLHEVLTVPGLHVCAPVPNAIARCHAIVQTDATGNPNSSKTPKGLGPKDLRSAYKLPSSGAGQVVAIVDAYDDPSAEKDVKTYRAKYGLPACQSRCVRKMNQRGGTSMPAFDEGWALEESLDLDAVTAVCPACPLLLVEAKSASINDLMAAEDQAAKHATIISNSWGASEMKSETSLDKHFKKDGVMITVSSGDNGYGVEWPAASPYVTAVGGTTLKKTSKGSRRWTERAWSGSGSGCSSYEPQPDWQAKNAKIRKVCRYRAVADVSADADPNTGFSVYDSSGYSGSKGWFVVGGTSLSAPIIAGVYGLAGNSTELTGASNAYSHSKSLYAVTSGNNGSCGNSLCKAGKGWGGPTGLGTPKGLGAF
ncbi:MAG: S53 family peptidase [Actinomycetota bacterium]